MPRTWLAVIVATFTLAVGTSAAKATFHLWQADEVYSSADGKIQFIELTTSTSGQNLFGTEQVSLVSTSGANGTGTILNILNLGPDLSSSNTAGHHLLLATPGFAALSGVTPDFTIPVSTLFLSGGSIHFHSDIAAENSETLNYGALPTDGTHSLNRLNLANQTLTSGLDTPTDFAGTTGAVAPEPATLSVVAVGAVGLLARRRR